MTLIRPSGADHVPAITAIHAHHVLHGTGTVAACGWKFGRRLDIVLMEKPLGAGSAKPPLEAAA